MTDRTMAPAWDFRGGKLLCLQCWSDQVKTTASRAKAKSNESQEPHHYSYDDYAGTAKASQRKGWPEYMDRKHNTRIVGTTLVARVSELRAMKNRVVDVDIAVRDT